MLGISFALDKSRCPPRDDGGDKTSRVLFFFCFRSANLWIFSLRPNAFPYARSGALLYYIISLLRDDSLVAAVGNKFGIFPYASTKHSYIAATTLYATLYIIILYNTHIVHAAI